jgi:hypothetical protein
MRMQDKKTGYFGAGMYSHALATMAMCEAYGMTKDPALKQSAQAAVNLIVNSQHDKGGWRYGPSKQPGDLSVTGFQVMALETAKAAGLTVPKAVGTRAGVFLTSCAGNDAGYCYTPGASSTPRMTAVGLLARQHIDGWNAKNAKLAGAIKDFIKTNPPDRPDCYYNYYAAQVMFQNGGKDWTDWNAKLSDYLVKNQDNNEKSPQFGSWSPGADQHGRAGGRIMVTSLNLLCLEIYYRHAPLPSRIAEMQDGDKEK